jgi:hypothetical protein
MLAQQVDPAISNFTCFLAGEMAVQLLNIDQQTELRPVVASQGKYAGSSKNVKNSRIYGH